MALTDEQLEIISDALVPLFQYLEKEVIADIARRIQQTLTYSRTAELQAMSMRELGYSPAKIRKEAMKMLNAEADYRKAVAKNTLEYKRYIRDIINTITKEAYKANNEIVANAGNMAWVNDLSVWKDAGKELTSNSFLHQLVEAFAVQTAGELKNMTQTTGFKTMSGYEAVENAYKRELDKALIKICSGTFSRDKVIADVVHDLAQSGLRSIDFANGYSMQLDTAARVAIRTGCHQLAGRVTDKNIELTGENLVYVSKHWGARNTGIGHANHEQWQGKVYFIKEGQDYSKEAERVGQDRITSLWYATGYSADGEKVNDPLGLNGYNCRHNHYPWFEGVSSIPKETPEPEPVVMNGKTYDYYAMTQKMRFMERSVRALKREKEALKVLGMDTKEIEAKISKKTSEYREFCKGCNVNPKNSRLRYEAGTSDLKKTKAWKNYGEIKVVSTKEAPSADANNVAVNNDESDVKKLVRGVINKVNDHTPIGINELPQRYAAHINSVINSAPQLVKEFTLGKLSEVKIVNENYLGRASNMSKGIRINLKKQAADKRGSYTTFFHEVGHSLDAAYGDVSVLHIFKTSLQNDFDNVVNSYCKYYNIGKDEAFVEISKVLKNDKLHSISDLCGALTNNKCVGKYRHSTSYWKDKADALEKEAFAHFYEATIRNDADKLDAIKGMFPSAYQIFEDMLR